MIPSVREYMDTIVHTLDPDTDIHEAVSFLLDNHVTGAPVIDKERRVIGIITEKDCLRLLALGDDDGLPEGRVADYMTTDVITIPQNMNIYFVAGMFLRDVIRRFPVVDRENKLIGAITRFDILRAIRANR